MTNTLFSRALRTAVDIQNNGGFAGRVVDFSERGLTPEMVFQVARRWNELGTPLLVPTIVTGSPEMYDENLRVLGDAIHEDPSRTLVFIHLEGPHISDQDGARGAHPKVFCHAERIEEFDRMFEASRGTIGLVTLAPEWQGAMRFIEHVSRRGVIVSLGHFLADAGIVREAIAAGACCCTHIGNACPLQLGRHDTLLLQQLAEERLYGCFITDGFHLGDEFARYAIKAKRQAGRRLPILVSDASPAAKAPPGEYTIFSGKRIVVRPDGAVIDPTQTTATYTKHAGSGAGLLDVMNGALRLGYSAADVIDMVTLNPWSLIEPTTTRLFGRRREYYAARKTDRHIDFDGERFMVVAA